MSQDPVFATIEYLEKKNALENVTEKSQVKHETLNSNALLKEFMTLLNEEMKKTPVEKKEKVTKKEKRFSAEKALKKTSNVNIKYSTDFLNLLDEELSKKTTKDEINEEDVWADQSQDDPIIDYNDVIEEVENTNVINEEVKDEPIEKIDHNDEGVREIDPISLYENFLSNSYKREIKEKTDFVTFDDLKKHYADFLNKINIQLGSLGGGGEVLLKRLDDLDFNTMQDGYFIKYDASTGKFVGHFIAQTSEIVDGGSF